MTGRSTEPTSDPGPVPRATTTGMIGAGFYDENSAPQWSAIAAVLPWIDQAVATMDLKASGGPVSIADYGCSEGGNSLKVMAHALKALRRHSQADVRRLFSDLPTNDYTSLLKALGTEGGQNSGDPSVFSAIVPGSMYSQLCPAGSLDFASTFNAIGFLSRRPLAQLEDYLLPNGPSKIRNHGFVSEEDRKTFARQAEADVTSFLKARAAELKPRGKLLMQVFGAGKSFRTCDGIYDLLNDAVLDFVQAGDIRQDTYAAYYQPVYFRTVDELIAPLTNNSDGLAALYELERSELYEVPVPFVEAYKETDDLETYSEAYVRFFRAFTQAPLKAALNTLPAHEALVDRIFKRAVERLKANPEHYPFRYVAVAALLSRK
ncbi:hypothetical protein [Roseibium sp. RKSG952]|uniref:hypothetical protein n=1 Tax=Roseibium sp. RKSG952 TaxID=2529384 RepID=UPI0012BBF1A0|nr:hypothetical protein [Roseibium sp. RKSG952]MTH95163.1 hypothetical protein [Roseibium sp. RKSG952]